MNCFFRISRQTPEKSEVCRFSIKFAKTNSKIAQIFEIVKINFIQFYSIVSLGAPRGRLAADGPRLRPEKGGPAVRPRAEEDGATAKEANEFFAFENG